MYIDIKNGSHKYNSPYFEWWYFHFISDENDFFNLLIHATDIFAENAKPYFSLSFLDASKNILYFKEELENRIFENCIERIYCDNNILHIEERKNSFIFNISLPDFTLQGEIIRVLPPIIFNNGILFGENEILLRNYWIITMPLGQFNFRVKLFNKERLLSGIAYHDHNWGNAKLQDFFEGWTWGHFVYKGGFLLFYKVKSINHGNIYRGIICISNKIYEVSEIKISLSCHLINSNEFDNNLDIELRFSKNEYMNIHINTFEIFRKRNDTKYKNFVPNYFRSSCNAEILYHNQKINSRGILENLSINRIGI